MRWSIGFVSTVLTLAACSGAPAAPDLASAVLAPGEATSTAPVDPGPACGNGVVDQGEACDPAIPAGTAGACPSSCRDSGCEKGVLSGSGCNVRCETQPITLRIGGDACCPAGATHANDSDCPAQYGEVCAASADCATGVCHKAPFCGPMGCTCTKFCNMAGPLSECGGAGRFCADIYLQGSTCTLVADTGLDADDKVVGIGVAVVGNIASANDVDILVFDAPAGSYQIVVTPIDANTFLDIAVDNYGKDGMLAFTVNDNGLRAAESYVLTAPVPQRTFLAIRTANTNAGNYRVMITN